MFQSQNTSPSTTSAPLIGGFDIPNARVSTASSEKIVTLFAGPAPGTPTQMKGVGMLSARFASCDSNKSVSVLVYLSGGIVSVDHAPRLVSRELHVRDSLSILKQASSSFWVSIELSNHHRWDQIERLFTVVSTAPREYILEAPYPRELLCAMESLCRRAEVWKGNGTDGS